MNILTIDNHRAVISYDPDTDMLRGEFLGLNGGADFYASDIPTLKVEGASLWQRFSRSAKRTALIRSATFRAASMPALTLSSMPVRSKLPRLRVLVSISLSSALSSTKSGHERGLQRWALTGFDAHTQAI